MVISKKTKISGGPTFFKGVGSNYTFQKKPIERDFPGEQYPSPFWIRACRVTVSLCEEHDL